MRQQVNKGPGLQTVDISEEEEDNCKKHQRVELQTVIMSGKQRNTIKDVICDFQSEDRETNSWNFQWVTKNDALDIVDGSTPSKKEKEMAHRAGAGNAEALAAPGVMPHHGKEKNEENLWMMVRTYTDRNHIKELLGASGLKEGAAGAVGA